MRQTYINIHINTIAIEHTENIKTIKQIKTQKAIQPKYTILFNIFHTSHKTTNPAG